MTTRHRTRVGILKYNSIIAIKIEFYVLIVPLRCLIAKVAD